MPNVTKGTKKNTAMFLSGIILILFVVTVSRTALCHDDYFMLANWREVLKIGFYTKDPLSMHHTYRASVEKWLSCAVLYYLYTYTGITRLRIAIAFCSGVIIYLMYQLCFYTSGNKMMSLYFVCIMYAMGCWLFVIRPQTVTTILLLTEALCLEHYVKEQKIKYLAIMPVLSWFEMQFHSTIWPCFFLVLIPYILNIEWKEKHLSWDKKQTTSLAICGGICFGTLFANPYGVWSVLYIFRSYGNKYMNACIGELAKPTLFKPSIAIWTVILMLAVIFGDRHMPVRYWLLCLGFFAFMFTAIRNEIFFDTIGAFPLCYMLRHKKGVLRYNLVPCLLIIAIGVTASETIRKTNDHTQDYVPVLNKLAADYGNTGSDIFCDTDTGSYATYIGYHPYIDCRAEIFIKKVNGVEELYKEYYEAEIGDLNYKNFLEKYDFKYLVINKDRLPHLYAWLVHDTKYKVLFTYKNFTVFAPNNISKKRKPQ